MTPLLFWTWLLSTRVFADLLLRKPSPTVRLSLGVETDNRMCRRGLHPMSGENLVLSSSARTACRECRRTAERARQRVRRASVAPAGPPVGQRLSLMFQQSVARDESPEKTCRDLNLSVEQYAAAIADWNELVDS